MNTYTCFLCGKDYITDHCAECIQSQDQARMYAIDYQNWASSQALSWGEVIHYQEIFVTLAEKYPELEEDFRENGII